MTELNNGLFLASKKQDSIKSLLPVFDDLVSPDNPWKAMNGNAKTPGRRDAKQTNPKADLILPFGLPCAPEALRLGVKMKSHIRQPADGDDRRFNPPEQPAFGVKRSHKDANHPARNGLFRWRYKIEFSSPALSTQQSSNEQ